MGELARSLGLVHSTGIGVASMLGAGVFFVWAPAYSLAGSWFFVSLFIAASVAAVNAVVTTQLAISVPRSGGIYASGRHYRGPLTGFIAGWMFLTGKTASVGAISLIAASYVWPHGARFVAVGLIVAATAVTIIGIRRTAALSVITAVVVSAGLTGLVVFSFATRPADPDWVVATSAPEPLAVLTAAGLMFFAFAGYARMATLSGEVTNPRRVLPQAIGLAFGIVLVLYTLVGSAVVRVLPGYAGEFDTPLRALAPGFFSAVLTGLAVVACVGSLVAVVAGLSRTAFHMGLSGDIPRALGYVSPRTGGPVVAEITVGVVASAAVLLLDVTALVAVSGAGVLTYYAIGHFAALAQPMAERLVPPAVPAAGLTMCLGLVVALPWASVLVAAVSLAIGAGWFAVAEGARRRLGT